MGKYKHWRTKVGRDSIDLRSSLAKWLGKRLLFLAKHTSGVPIPYYERPNTSETEAMQAWQADLAMHGAALLIFTKDDSNQAIEDAQKAMHWVADNLPDLWD